MINSDGKSQSYNTKYVISVITSSYEDPHLFLPKSFDNNNIKDSTETKKSIKDSEVIQNLLIVMKTKVISDSSSAVH